MDRLGLLSVSLLRVEQHLAGVGPHFELDHSFVLLTLRVPGGLQSDGDLALPQGQVGSERDSHVEGGADSSTEVLLGEGAQGSHLGVLLVVKDGLGLDLDGAGPAGGDGGVGGHDEGHPLVQVQGHAGHGGQVGEVVTEVQHLHEVSLDGVVLLYHLLGDLPEGLLYVLSVHREKSLHVKHLQSDVSLGLGGLPGLKAQLLLGLLGLRDLSDGLVEAVESVQDSVGSLEVDGRLEGLHGLCLGGNLTLDVHELGEG